MAEHSYGILLYRKGESGVEVLLCHSGGPFFAKKDKGWWSIPKGIANEGEEPLDAARREFKEEIGFMPEGEFISLGIVRQKGGKIVEAWAVEGDLPEGWKLNCSTFFTIEWPPRSGQKKSFPEIDKAEFFPLAEARGKINEAQRDFLDRLEKIKG